MYDAQAPHELCGEVPLLRRERGAPGERDSLRAVDDVSVGVLRDEAVVARRLDVLRELVEHEVPALLFPLGAAGRPIHRFLDTPGGCGELHGRRTLRTEPALVHRTVGVAFDLQQLGLAVYLFGVGDERAPDRA